MAETRRTYCGLWHPRCGLLLEIENGKAVKVSGDPDHAHVSLGAAPD
jgi:hypothetical protein